MLLLNDCVRIHRFCLCVYNGKVRTWFRNPGGSACCERPSKTPAWSFRMSDLGVSENRGTLFGGPYNKDPTI